jgi:iron-sulfur cluster insertion protein
MNIVLTDKAVAKLKEFSVAEEIGHLCIRVKCVGGGCAGLQRDMFFDDFVGEMDEVVEQDGIKVIVDQLSAQYFENTTLDYVEREWTSGFMFSDPTIKTTCGCGSSFSV